jgi:FixJ family two-component response regulator
MSDKLATRGEMFAVNRHPAVRDSLCVVLAAGAYRVLCFPDGATLTAVARSRDTSCIPLDMHFPRKSGLDLRKENNGHDQASPLFMISGQGDIRMAVHAIKNGALDFIDKPFRGREVVNWLDQAIGAYARRHARFAEKAAPPHSAGRERLTPREREVLEQFVSGASNKEAGRRLGISPRTVEDHRANIMKKLGARNAADLIRIVMTGFRSS